MRQLYFFKGLLISLMLIIPACINAYDFEVDGICYDKNSDGVSVSVTYEKLESVTFEGMEFEFPYSNYSGAIVIPETVTYKGTTYNVASIGDNAFNYCSSLVSVTIPKSVTSIGRSAFQDCNALTSITIPSSVSTIGGFAFNGCSNLTSITIPEGVTSIDSCTFNGCSNLTSITIPEGVTSIGGVAFQRCSSLHSVIIPSTVTSIGGYAFYGCSNLTSITIPESLTSIGESAFYQCHALTSIYCINPTPCTLGSDAFAYVQYDNIDLYVPKGATDTYMAAEGWDNFFNVYEFDAESVVSIGDVQENGETACVKTENGTIVVENYIGAISIYGMSGRIVKEVSANDGRMEVMMPQHGVYVVKIGDKAVKVAL